jgi:hypothetical protein
MMSRNKQPGTLLIAGTSPYQDAVMQCNLVVLGGMRCA